MDDEQKNSDTIKSAGFKPASVPDNRGPKASSHTVFAAPGTTGLYPAWRDRAACPSTALRESRWLGSRGGISRCM